MDRREVTEADAGGIWTPQTAIFAVNEPSIALHTSCGYRVVGTRERIASATGCGRTRCCSSAAKRLTPRQQGPLVPSRHSLHGSCWGVPAPKKVRASFFPWPLAPSSRGST